jgi:hypothetical protein
MSIIRTKRRENFTVIPNEIINDPELQGEDLGLLVFLLSKPADWKISIEGLAGLKRFGSKNTVNATLKILRNMGYAAFQKHKDGSATWTIYDTRQAESQIPKSGICPDPKKPNPKKPDLGFWDVLQRTDLDKELKEEQRTVSSPPCSPPSQNPALPEWLDPELWAAFRIHRKTLRKPMSAKAEELNIRQLSELRSLGQNPAEILEITIANGWQGVSWAKDRANRTGGIHHAARQHVDNSAPAKVRRAYAERHRREQQAAGGERGSIIDLDPADYHASTH